MFIRKANIQEIDSIMEVYQKARIFMAEHDNPKQWGKNRPTREQVVDDIANGYSYICEEDGKIATVFFYRKGNDPTYEKIYDGQWLDDTPYGVVHRIASSGICKGAGSFCMKWALEQCKNVRIDTHKDNYVMQNMLKKNGFVYCGMIFIEDGSERMAFQRKI